MSRRARRRKGSGAGGGRLAKWAAVLIALFLIAAAAFYAGVRGYLHSEGFRRLLSDQVSAAAGVSGEFEPFRWDGLTVNSEAFNATGDGLIHGLRLDGLQTEVMLGGLRRGVWELGNSRARRIQLLLDARGTEAAVGAPPIVVEETPPPVASKPRKSKRQWLPKEVEMRRLELQEVSLDAFTDDGMLTARGLRIDVERADRPKSHHAQVSGGTLVLPYEFIPPVQLDEARLRSQPGGVFLTSLKASAWSAGRLEAGGEWDLETGALTLDGRISGVRCEEVFNEDWSRRLSGDLSTDYIYALEGGKGSASGRLVLERGVLTALPVLDVLAAYVDTRRFRTLVLSEAHCHWSWEPDMLVFDRIVLASDNLIRVEGRLVIRGEELDGTLRLGLAPGSLSGIPGAETHVFEPGERGMMWAPLRITGTTGRPREDLSDRLLAAAGMRLLETIPATGEKVLKFSRSVLGEDPYDAVEKGVRIIEEGSRAVREVSGLLDGILGSGRNREPDPPPRESPEP